MADGMYESYVHSVAAGADDIRWVTHGRNIPGATVIDGYGTRKVAFEKGSIRPFDRVFGEPGGWAWGLTRQGFRIFDGSGAWNDRAVALLNGSVDAKPLVAGKALVLQARQLLEYDFAKNTAEVLWDGATSHIGAFAEMAGDLGQGLWIAGERGAGRLRGTPDAAQKSWEWAEFREWPTALSQFRHPTPGIGGEVFVTATAPGRSCVLLQFDGREWRTIYRTSNEKSSAWRGADDSVWIKDGDAIYRRQGGALQKIPGTALPSDSITDVATEPGGAFWLATYDGLARNAPQIWRTPAAARGIESSVYGIEDDDASGLWILTATNLIHLAGAQQETIPVPKRWTPLVFRADSLLVMRDGGLVAPCPERKLLHFDPRTREFREIVPPGGSALESLTPRGDGTAWAVTRTKDRPGVELSVYDGEFQKGLPLEWDASGVLTVRQTSNGTIWIGGPNQLSAYENGRLREVGRESGYTDTGAYALAEVQPGKLWVGGRSKLMEFDGRNWRVLRDADRTRMILPARDGSIWVAASDGVYRYQNGTWLDYGLEEGLPSSIGFRVHQDRSNRIWVGTTLGLSMFHPEADTDPPRAYIPEHLNPAQAGRGEARLLFSGVDKWKYTAADRLLFSYRIDGHAWSTFAPNRAAVYPDLGTGRHRFEVRAMDRAGNLSPQPASFSFSVVPPWYMAPGFLASAILSGMVISYQLLLLAVNYSNRGRLIAQLKLAHAEADRQREEAERANRSKSQFLANMSHEIRTPMNGVLGMAELAQHAETEEERREYLGVVQQSASSLLAILNDILDVSKIEADKVELACEPFHPRDCVAEALQPLTVAAGEKNLELVARIAPDVPDRVVGDSVRLRQVLVNLLGNSLKFTDAGEVVLDLAMEKEGADHVVLRFLIRDTGIGIPPEKQQVIFQPFEQGDGSTTRRFGGTGLGLAISAGLVEMMGGRIDVRSPWNYGLSPGGPGTQFGFSVRFGKPESVGVRKVPDEDTGLEGVPVLIVEDNASSREALTGILAHAGMQVVTAVDGREAMEKLKSARLSGAPIPISIVDRTLPDADGWELAGQIRRNPEHLGIRLILLNAPGRKAKAVGASEVSIDAYLSKPVDDRAVVRAVAAALRKGKEPAPESSLPPEAPLPPQARLRILVAEDNPVNQKVAKLLLEKRGHVVDIASDGLQAVALQEQGAFDLILMDLQMPGKDGCEATAAIRRLEEARGTRRTPIIALTAHAMKEEVERCLAAGMDGYISKPIQIAELNAAIEKVAPPKPDGPR